MCILCSPSPHVCYCCTGCDRIGQNQEKIQEGGRTGAGGNDNEGRREASPILLPRCGLRNVQASLGKTPGKTKFLSMPSFLASYIVITTSFNWVSSLETPEDDSRNFPRARSLSVERGLHFGRIWGYAEIWRIIQGNDLSIIDLTHSVINHPIYFFRYIHHSFSFISLLPLKSRKMQSSKTANSSHRWWTNSPFYP